MAKHNASLRGLFFDQLNGETKPLPCTSIEVHQRERPLDSATVGMLSDSIETVGLLQPIGVRRSREGEPGAYHLIYGAHRFTAWFNKFATADAADDDEGRARWHSIPCVLFGRDVTPDMEKLLELRENTDRKELTMPERKRMTAEACRLLESMDGGKSKAKGSQKSELTFTVPIQKEMIEASGVHPATFKQWYKSYREESDAPVWNKQTKAQYEAWQAWLHKTANEEEERKKEAAKAKANTDRDKSRKAIHKAIADHIKKFPEDAGMNWL